MTAFPSNTRFFRHESLLDVICDRVTAVLETKQSVRIHVCACSIGMEPISIAIRLHEAGLADKCDIIASDVSADNIAVAEVGVFDKKTARGLNSGREAVYFVPSEDKASIRYLYESGAPIRYEVVDLTDTPDDRLRADIVVVNNVFPKIETFIDKEAAQRITHSALKLLEDDLSLLCMFGEKPDYVMADIKQAGLIPIRSGLLSSLIADETARKVWSISEPDQILARPDWLEKYGAFFAPAPLAEAMDNGDSLAGFNPELMAVTEKAIHQLAVRPNAADLHVAICDTQPSIGGLRVFDLLQKVGGNLRRTYHSGTSDLDPEGHWRIPYAIVNALPAQTRLRMFNHDRPPEGVHPSPATLEGWTLSLPGTHSRTHPAISAQNKARLRPNISRLFGPQDSQGNYPYKSSIDYGPISRALIGEEVHPKDKNPYFPIFDNGDVVTSEINSTAVELEPRRADFLPPNSIIIFEEDLEEQEVNVSISDEEGFKRPHVMTLKETEFHHLPADIRKKPFFKPSADYETFSVILRTDLPSFKIPDADQTEPDIDLLILTDSFADCAAETRRMYLETWAPRVKPGGICIFLNDGHEPEIVEALRHKGLFAVTGGALADPVRIWSGSPSHMGQPYPKSIADQVAAHWVFAREGDAPLLDTGERLEPLIARAENVSLSFPRHFRRAKSEGGQRFQALSNVSFDIRHGEILGIIGRNGAGKSTLLKVLAEVFRPDTGQFHVDGRSRLAALGLGLNLDLSGRDNINQMCAFLGLSRAQRKTAEHDVITFTQLGEFIDMPVRYYSSGMRARLSFAITTVEAPDLLLLDEVFATGDQDFAKASKARLQNVLASAGAVVIVSHQMGVLRSLANRVVWLERGEVKGIGHPDEIVSAYLNSDRIPDTEVDTAPASDVKLDNIRPLRRAANG